MKNARHLRAQGRLRARRQARAVGRSLEQPSHGPGAARPARAGRSGCRWSGAWSEPRRPIVGRQGVEPGTFDGIGALLDRSRTSARDGLFAAIEPLTDDRRTRDMGSSCGSIDGTIVHRLQPSGRGTAMERRVADDSARRANFPTSPRSARAGRSWNGRCAGYVDAAGPGRAPPRLTTTNRSPVLRAAGRCGRWCSMS